MSSSSRLACLLLLAAGLGACGPRTADADLAEAIQAIFNGVPDTDPAHDAVVAVVRRYKGYDSAWSLCTGTVIAPGVVLTAAHCGDGGASVYYTIVFGAATQGAEERTVNAVWVHPDWDPDLILNDVSLMRFSGGTPAGVVPLPHLPAEKALGQGDVGAQVHFIGYGRTEDGTITAKLISYNYLSYLCDVPEDCQGAGVYMPAGVICYWGQDGPGNTCSGDSGGPWTLIREGQEYVAGVTSYHVGQCGDLHCASKVDAFAEFIEAFIAADLQRGEACTDDLECLSGHCADGVCCDYACDGLCEACNLAGSEGSCTLVDDNAIEPGCKSGGGGCAAAPAPAGGSPWAGLVLLGLFGLILAARARRDRPRG